MHLPPLRRICAIRGTVRVVSSLPFSQSSTPPFSLRSRCFSLRPQGVSALVQFRRPEPPFSSPSSLALRKWKRKKYPGILDGGSHHPTVRVRAAYTMYRDRGGMHLEQHRRDGALPSGGVQDVFFRCATVGRAKAGAVRIFLCKNGHGKKRESLDQHRSNIARQVRRESNRKCFDYYWT